MGRRHLRGSTIETTRSTNRQPIAPSEIQSLASRFLRKLMAHCSLLEQNEESASHSYRDAQHNALIVPPFYLP